MSGCRGRAISLVKLNSSEAAIVMGFALKYDIAEVVDPHIKVVAKFKKTDLAQDSRNRVGGALVCGSAMRNSRPFTMC